MPKWNRTTNKTASALYICISPRYPLVFTPAPKTFHGPVTAYSILKQRLWRWYLIKPNRAARHILRTISSLRHEAPEGSGKPIATIELTMCLGTAVEGHGSRQGRDGERYRTILRQHPRTSKTVRHLRHARHGSAAAPPLGAVEPIVFGGLSARRLQRRREGSGHPRHNGSRAAGVRAPKRRSSLGAARGKGEA